MMPLILAYSKAANTDSEKYKISLSALSNLNYILNEFDRKGSLNGNDRKVTLKKSDNIIFDFYASSNIKTKFSCRSNHQ